MCILKYKKKTSVRKHFDKSLIILLLDNNIAFLCCHMRMMMNYTGWPKIHFTEKSCSSSKRTDFVINDRGMSQVCIHQDTPRQTHLLSTTIDSIAVFNKWACLGVS